MQRIGLMQSLEQRAAEAQSANVAKSQFLASMSHELAHAHERGPGNDGPGPGGRAFADGPRLHRHGPGIGRHAPGIAQRHPRLVADRGRQAAAGSGPFPPAVAVGQDRQVAGHPGLREGPGAALRRSRRRARPPDGRRPARAAGAHQSGRQCHQVHPQRRDHGPRGPAFQERARSLPGDSRARHGRRHFARGPANAVRCPSSRPQAAAAQRQQGSGLGLSISARLVELDGRPHLGREPTRPRKPRFTSPYACRLAAEADDEEQDNQHLLASHARRFRAWWSPKTPPAA